MKKRLGLIGFGFIGAGICRRVMGRPELGLEIAFVHNRSRDRIAGVAAGHVLDRLDDFAQRRSDLVVEVAHPDYTRRRGEAILAHSDYLPLSVTALAEDALRERLIAAARASGRRLLLPHGALVGCDSLIEWRHMWETVEIAFRKRPRNIEFTESGFDTATILGETVVCDGPARGIADPALEVAIAEVVAHGRDGSRLSSIKEQPATGVSGTEMFESQFHSILKAAGLIEPFDFV